jgi:hypothetical protein
MELTVSAQCGLNSQLITLVKLIYENTSPVLNRSQDITGWLGFVRVDGQTYRFLGDAAFGVEANQTGLEWTATRSTFEFAAGPVTIIAEFLTPIEVISTRNLQGNDGKADMFS